MKITLVYSPKARDVREWTLEVPQGHSLEDAVNESGIYVDFPDLKMLIQNQNMLGIWGRGALPDQILQENDRIEIYRELRVDPKTARRERFNKQGAKMAGLFSGVRAGGKAGY